jgi:predicted MFS family arabinose efflux permease
MKPMRREEQDCKYIETVPENGNMAASTPLVLLVQSVGWRMAFIIIASVNLLQIVLLLLVVRNRPGAAVFVNGLETFMQQ